MATICISNGRVIDPSQGIDQVANVLITGSRIERVGRQIPPCDQMIEADGMIVCPGLVDMHVHLREPGGEEDETIATGTRAALAGGITSVACMPNTTPALDNQGAAEFVLLQAQRANNAHVFPVGAVTKGRQGQELAEIGQLVQGGAVAFSDDGSPIVNAEIMRRALQYVEMFGRTLLSHCEDPNLTADGVMNEGFVSTCLGLRGMPAQAEDIMVSRDIMLAGMSESRVHIMHITTRGSVDLVRRGRQRGIQVTCEATPHHFSLTDECMRSFDSCYKMNPPLRTQDDVDAVIEGLRDGTIDVIASDHAPHAEEKKMRELNLAPFGVVGLETLLPVAVTKLVVPGHLTWAQLIATLTVNPAGILGIDKGTLRPGADADVTVIDPDAEWTVDPRAFHSKSRNTPFAGWTVRGRAQTVIVGGSVKTAAHRGDA